MSAIDEQQMYYAATTDSRIDTNTTYIHIPDSDSAILAITCGEERVTISCKDLFKLLKWAYRQWGGKQ